MRKFSKFSIINAFDRKENKTKKNIVNWFNFKTAAYVTMFSVLCVAIVLTVHFVLPQGRTLTASVETNCGIEEHKHSPDCYDADGNVVCGKIEHYHTSDCFAQNVADYVDYKCGFDYAHEHSDDCYKNGVLTCSLTEHHHTVRCLFDGSNYGDACDEYITACTRLVKTLDYTSNEEYINLIKSDVDDVAAFINEAYDSNAIYTSQYNDLKAQVTALTNDFNAQVAEQIEASKAPETADNNEDSPVEVVPVKKEALYSVDYSVSSDLESSLNAGRNHSYNGRTYGVAYAIKIGSGRTDGYSPTTQGQIPKIDSTLTYDNYELKLYYFDADNNGEDGYFFADPNHTIKAQYVDFIPSISNPIGQTDWSFNFMQKGGGTSTSIWRGALVGLPQQGDATQTDPRTIEDLYHNIGVLNCRIQQSAMSGEKTSGIPRISRVVIQMDSYIHVKTTENWGYYNTTSYGYGNLDFQNQGVCTTAEAEFGYCHVFDLYIRRGTVANDQYNRMIDVSSRDSTTTNLYIGAEVTIDNYTENANEVAVKGYQNAEIRLIGGRIINSKATSENKYGTGVWLDGAGVSSVQNASCELFSGAVICGAQKGVRIAEGTVRFCQQIPYTKTATYNDWKGSGSSPQSTQPGVSINTSNYAPYSVVCNGTRNGYCDIKDNTCSIRLEKDANDNELTTPYIIKMWDQNAPLSGMPENSVSIELDGPWGSNDVIVGSGYTEQQAYWDSTHYCEVTYQDSVTVLSDVTGKQYGGANGTVQKQAFWAYNFGRTKCIGVRGNVGNGTDGHTRVRTVLARNDLAAFNIAALNLDTEFIGKESGSKVGGDWIEAVDDRYPALRIANEDMNVYVTLMSSTLNDVSLRNEDRGGWFRNLTEAVGIRASFESQTKGSLNVNYASNASLIIWNDTVEDTALTATGNKTTGFGITDGIIFRSSCTVRNTDGRADDKAIRDYYTLSSDSKRNPDNDDYNDYTVKWTVNTNFNTDWPGESGKESEGHIVYNLDYCMIVNDNVEVTFGGASNGSLTFDAGSNDFEMVNIKGVDFLFQIDNHEHSDKNGYPGKIQNPLICLREGAKLNLGTESGTSKVILTNGSVPAEAVANTGTEPGQDTRACGIMMKGSNELRMYANSKITNCVGFWAGAIYTQGSDCVVDINEDTEISYITSMRSPVYLVNDADVTIDGCLFEHNYCRFGLFSSDKDSNTEGRFYQSIGSAGGRGGAIYIADGADVSIRDSKFMYNACDVYGGAIYTTDNTENGVGGNGYLTVDDTEFCYNFAVRGGAVQVDGFAREKDGEEFITTFNGCYFHNNIAYAADATEETYNTTGSARRTYIGYQNDGAARDSSSGRGGAIRVTDGGTDLILNDCVIVDNIAETRGGGICISDNNDIILNNTIIAENYAKDTTYGLGDSKLLVSKPNDSYTGMTLDSASFDISLTPGSFKSGNAGGLGMSNQGGGIAIDNDDNANIATLTINGTSLIGKKTSAVVLPTNFGFAGLKDTYTGNYAYDGGGVHAIASNKIYFVAGDISDNVADSEGGGVYAQDNVVITVTAGNTNRNYAYRRGGGYYLKNSATLTLNGGEIKNNFTTHVASSSGETYGGGGIYCQDTTTVLINGAAIENNISGGNGGGILANGSSASHTIVTFTKGTIKSNTTCAGGASNGAIQCKGGGIYAMAYSKILMNSTSNTTDTTDANRAAIQSNKALNGAGVFLDDDALMDITGGDISSNEATQDGGGMFINKRATANLTSGVRISIKKNKAVNGAGINVVTDAATSSSAIADCTLNGTSANLVIQDNAASNNGGGIRIASGGYVEAKGTTDKIFIGNNSDHKNTAGNDGGGVYITGCYTGNSQNILSTFNMKAGQIMHNTAAGDGGGVCIKDYGVMYLSDKDNAPSQHIKIHSNTATDGTGIYQDGTLYLNGGPLFYISGQNNQHTSANDIFLAAQVVTSDTANLTDVIEPNATTATVHVITKNGPISDNIKDDLTDWPNSASRTSTGGTASIPVTLGQMAGADGGNNFDGRDYVVSLNDKNEINADTTTVIPADLTKFWVKNPTVYDCIYNDSANSASQDKIGNYDINAVAVLELDVKQTYSIDVRKQVGLDKNMYPSFNETTVAYDTNSGVSKTFNYTATIIGGTFDAVTFGGTHEAVPVETNSTTITFSLKSGENLLIENLAPGSSVTITETPDTNYTAYSKVDAPFTDNETLPAASNTKTISSIDDSHTVYFKNVPVNKLFLVKKLAGDGNTQSTGTFSFKFRITDKAGNRITTTLGSTSGYTTTSEVTATEDSQDPGTMIFTLGFNDQIVFNIPYGMVPYVEEVPAPGFTTYVRVNGSGLTVNTDPKYLHYNNKYTYAAMGGSDKSAYFYNTASAALPNTRGVNVNIFTAAGMSIMLLAVAAAFVVRAYARKH